MNVSESEQKKLLIIVPAYNEAARITETVNALLGVHQNLSSAGFMLLIYVVDDGSEDETRRLAHEAGAHRVLRHRVNIGLGAAVRTGLKAAKSDGADIVVKFDADLQHDPNDILTIIQPILDDEADVVFGNRFERIEYRMPLVRRIGNIFFTGLIRWLTKWPIKDSQPGIFAIDREYLNIFHLPGDYNYTQQILLDAYHQGMRFAHMPVAFRKRLTGKSFVSLKYPFHVLHQIIMVLVGIKPMSIFAPIGFLFLLVGSLVFSWELILWLLGETHKPVIHVYTVLGFSLFGLQTLFFGILAELIVKRQRHY